MKHAKRISGIRKRMAEVKDNTTPTALPASILCVQDTPYLLARDEAPTPLGETMSRKRAEKVYDCVSLALSVESDISVYFYALTRHQRNHFDFFVTVGMCKSLQVTINWDWPTSISIDPKLPVDWAIDKLQRLGVLNTELADMLAKWRREAGETG